MPRFSFKTRLCLDALLAVLFVSGLAFRATGRVSHEWLGIGFALLFGLHLAINAGWYRRLFQGRYGMKRTLNTATNMALLASILLLCVTGVMNSRHIFGLSQYFDGESLRWLHSAAAYWSLVFIGVHTGLHWEMILGAFHRLAGQGLRSRVLRLGLQAATLFVAVCGVWASYDRAMGSKLFLGFAFDFWDSERPLILFYTANFAIVGLYAIAAHYASKLVRIRSRVSKK